METNPIESVDDRFHVGRLTFVGFIGEVDLDPADRHFGHSLLKED